MSKRELLNQIERDLLHAQDSADFWRDKIPVYEEGPLKLAVEGALDNAITAMAVLHRLKEQLRNG